ncbi:MAG: type II toxin-antitoxin system VapC family toxin [Cyanobacteria bacterium M_surface_7_m2_040]|nr:type II toxin-antitoxin system VapC family toxin [Cyanobacteria bacterium M_surface_9_m1_291]MBM5827954.1 type II toxin-antitoxin system VapC family toxin [Cyanobacteria bacterium M_surface_7_m2_040]
MHCGDVNVLVQACIAGTRHHRPARAWLLQQRCAPQGLGLFSVVVSGFLRVVTNRRVFSASPTVRILEPGPRHLEPVP